MEARAPSGTDDEEVDTNSAEGFAFVDEISRLDIVPDAAPSSNDTKMDESLSSNASAGTLADRYDASACNPP